MAKYEAHITLDKRWAGELKDDIYPIRQMHELQGWQYSAIDDDPIMGQKPYCYLTSYDTSDIRLLERMVIVEKLLTSLSIPVLRTKLERIILDSKTQFNELGA